MISKEDGLSSLDKVLDSDVEEDNFWVGMCNFGRKFSLDVVPIAA